jgi:branched-chain amino acid transport system permease protein
MKLHTRKTAVITFAAVMLLILPLLATIPGHSYFVSLCSRIIIYAIAAVSLDLLLGYAGMVSLGHAAYVGVGAYVVAIFFFHLAEMEPILTWPFLLEGSNNGLLVLPLAVVISAFFALIIGALCLRTRGMHFYHDHPRLRPDDLLFFCLPGKIRR